MFNKFKRNWKKWSPSLRMMALMTVVAFGTTFSTVNAQEKKAQNFAADLSPEAIQQRISYRVNDSKLNQFLASTNDRQVRALFMEISQLVDQRHVAPTSYQERTSRALNYIAEALENPEFLRKNGVRASEQTLDRARKELRSKAKNVSARTAQEAAQAMSWSMYQLAGGVGINPATIGMEFIQGNIDSLDKYSAFKPNAQVSKPRVELKSREELVGIGVEMKQHEKGVIIVRPVQGSPAEKAGIRRGDIINGINGQSVAGKGINEIANMISGNAGTQILLKVLRNDSPRMINVTRGRLVLESVSEARIIDSAQGTAYIRIDQFADQTARQLEKALWKLHRQGMKSLIIDLRGNPGGLLNVCIEMSDMFLPQGNIVGTRGRNLGDNSLETAKFDRTWKVPMVVLVDGNSASASEIFAAAMQDNGRAIIVGRKSYGKGTVQTHIPLRTVSGNLKLTTAKFYSPNGREMAGTGVTPDVVVEKSDEITSVDKDIATAVELINNGRPQQIVNQMRNPGSSNS